MRLRRSLAVVLTVTWAGALSAFAQIAKPHVTQLGLALVGQEEVGNPAPRVINFDNNDGVTVEFADPPAVGANNPPANPDMTNWLRVKLHYSVNPEHADKYPWVDSAQFKIWIEGRDLYAANAPAGGFAVCLTGEVTYINLPAARDSYGVFYVHPSALARYCGSGTPQDFDRKFNIHVEASVGGKLVDYFDKIKNDPGGPNWFKAPPTVSDLVLNQANTPFLLSDPNHYPEAKSSSGAAGQ